MQMCFAFDAFVYRERDGLSSEILRENVESLIVQYTFDDKPWLHLMCTFL